MMGDGPPSDFMYILVYFFYKLSRTLYKARVPVLPSLIKVFIRIVFSSVIPPSADIGPNTRIGYGGLGTVFHRKCVVGSNCIIHGGVTIGATSSILDEAPVIGDNVLIGAGAVILGPIKIGENVVIGANAVVLKDVPPNCLVAGVPAKIVKENIKITDYRRLKEKGGN